MKKRVFILDDGTKAYFSRQKLKKIIFAKTMNLGSDKVLSQQAVLEDIAENIGVSYSSLKHWIAGHNAPSDMDKIKDMAAALEVDVENLFDKEEENEEMVKENAVNNNEIYVDYNGMKAAVRNIYKNISCFIEKYRMNRQADLDSDFAILYASLMNIRLDIPKAIFDEINDFMINYLQQMVVYESFMNAVNTDQMFYKELIANSLAEAYADSYGHPQAEWNEAVYVSFNADSENYQAFIDAIKKEEELMEESFACMMAANSSIVIGKAYNILENIFEDFIIK